MISLLLLSACQDDSCPADMIPLYEDLQALDQTIQKRVDTFDSTLPEDLGRDENYLALQQLKAERDQLVFELKRHQCTFAPPSFSSSELNSELNDQEDSP